MIKTTGKGDKAMSDTKAYEIDLACGDTISSNTAPALGAYRTCIHCDSKKRVTGVREPTGAQPVEDGSYNYRVTMSEIGKIDAPWVTLPFYSRPALAEVIYYDGKEYRVMSIREI